MEFRRALRILTARWWVIALAGVLVAGLAVVAARALNAAIEPEFEARATVDYIKIAGETDESFKARLGDARSTALGLLDNIDQSVVSDQDSSRLTITMTGPEPDALLAEVTRLREEFLSTDSEQKRFEEITTIELARLQAEIDDVRAQLQGQGPPSVQVDPATAAEREQLQFEINSLRQRIASLRIQIAFPELAAAGPETLQADLDRSQELLVRLTAGLDALPSTEPLTSTTVSLDTLVLQRHLQDLESRYVSFSLGLLEQPDVIGPISPASFVDNTREAISSRLAAAAGLVAGMASMVVILLVRDRIRQPLWTAEDIDLPVPVGTIDRARPGANGRPWYPHASRSARRREIQAFRAALDPIFAGGSVSIGLTGVSVAQEDVQALAADLAVSVAASGTRVLLVDAAFGGSIQLPEFGEGEADLAGLISGSDRTGAVEAIKRALVDQVEVLPELMSIRAGSGIGDATDALAGPKFRAFLDIAGELDESVIVVAGPFGDPGTEVLSQRLDHMVLVCRSRHTKRNDIEAASDELSHRSARLSAVALLSGKQARRSSGSVILAGFRGYGRHRARLADRNELLDRQVTPDSHPDDEQVDSIVEPAAPFELQSSKGDGDIRPSDIDVALTDVAGGAVVGATDTTDGVGSADRDSRAEPDRRKTRPASRSEHGRHARPAKEEETTEFVGPELVTDSLLMDPGLEIVIDDRHASESERDEAERYLVTQVLRMLGIDSEEMNESARAVADQQMVLVTVEDDEPNAAETLAGLIELDEPSRSIGIERGLMALLGGRISTWQLHRWIQNSFFEQHVALSAGSPIIWHLATPNRAFEVLIRADQLNRELLHGLRARIRRTIDRLILAIAGAGGAGDLEKVEVIESRLAEVRAFDDLILELWREEQQASRELDRAAKLAVLRDLGVVPDAAPIAAD